MPEDPVNRTSTARPLQSAVCRWRRLSALRHATRERTDAHVMHKTLANG